MAATLGYLLGQIKTNDRAAALNLRNAFALPAGIQQTVMEIQSPLTNLQRELLELFALELPDEELVELRRQLARHFLLKATTEMDAFCAEHDVTADDLQRWAHEHERASTDRS